MLLYPLSQMRILWVLTSYNYSAFEPQWGSEAFEFKGGIEAPLTPQPPPLPGLRSAARGTSWGHGSAAGIAAGAVARVGVSADRATGFAL